MQPRIVPSTRSLRLLPRSPRWGAVALALVCGSLAAHAALTDGLLSYWPLNTDDGGATPDVAFTNTMSIVGSPVVSAGVFGNAFTLNGSSTYLTNLHSFDRAETGLPLYGAGGITVAMWVKGAAQTAKYLFSEASTTNGNPIFIIQTGQAAANNAKLDVILRTTGGTILLNHVVSTNVVFDNTWHHIAWVDNRGSVRLYIDGNPDPANFNYGYVEGGLLLNTTAIGTLVRAAISTGAIFNGQIDEVAVWERALSQAEVNELRTSGLPATVPPHAPVLHVEPADAVKRQGEWHLFAVGAYGSRPYVTTYQWSRNGAPIPDATRATYLATGLQTNNSGDYYSVTAANDLGSVTSSNATLTVLPDPAPNLTNGLVNYWPLDTITADDTNLFSPELHFGHRMDLRNFADASDIVPGQFSNALYFDATLPKYGVRAGGRPIYESTNYSVSFWVKANGAGQNDRRVFSEGSTLENNSLFTLGTDPAAAGGTSLRPFFRTAAGAGSAANARLTSRPVFDDNWHHVVWTDANGQGRVYVDGVMDETDFSYTRVPLTLNLTMLGVTARIPAPVTPFTGILDEVATWSRVLTWTEIQQIMTNGVPVPEGIVAPAIVVQPPERTNDVVLHDDVTFPIQVSGSLPMAIQWYRNGAVLPAAQNPTAVTETLTLPDVQLADAGSTFFVTVANAAGAVTSSVVQLTVVGYSPATNGEVLKLDVALTGSPNPQPGFDEMSLGDNPKTFPNVVRVTLAGLSAPLADRLRTTVVDNGTTLTQARIYNDFVFANSAVNGTGMKVLLERLAPNTVYGVTLWSFDPVSTGARVADWTETSTGFPIPVQYGYSFDGAALPAADYDSTLGALLTSSSTGKLVLEGVRNGGSSFGVFLNAIRLVANPVIRITKSELVNGNLRLTAEGKYPGQPMYFEETADLTSGVWAPASTGGVVEMHGPAVVGEFTLGTEPMFYRAVGF